MKPLSHALVILLLFKAVAGNTSSAFFEDRGQDDVIFPENLLFETRAWTSSDCSVLCAQRSGCVSLTFTSPTSVARPGVCRGHYRVHYCRDGTMFAANTRYFQEAASTAQSCQDVEILQPGSGVRQLNIVGYPLPVSAYCDQDTDCGRWTVIQRRQDGSVDFNRIWAEYQAGFGDPAGEYWLGLETVHRMTTTQSYELRFDLELYNGTTGWAVYSNFSVGPDSDFYRLHLGNMTAGNLPEKFTHHQRLKFTTLDRDNDNAPTDNCAVNRGGGWWYGACGFVLVNGPYRLSSSCPNHCYQCLIWHTFGNFCNNALRKAAMKIRPV